MKALKTKDKIIMCALQLLEKSGIQAVTQPAVAKLASITQGQLTYHFPKRTDLILALSEAALSQVADFIFNQKIDNSQKKEEKMRSLLWNIMKDHARVRALIGLVTEADTNEEVRRKLLDQEEKVRLLISFAMGVEPQNPLVTTTHATLLGFGMLSFIKRDDNLYKDFIFASELLNKTAPKNKKKVTV